MGKTRLISLLEEGDDFDSLLALVKSKLADTMYKGTGRNTWINEEGAKLLDQIRFAPEIVAKRYAARVKKPARNPSFVFAHVRELDKMVPVSVPRKLQKSLPGKNIIIEAIEDDTGVSYRYERQGVA